MLGYLARGYMSEEDTNDLKERLVEVTHQMELQKQQQKFWRWVIIGAAGLSNGDVALTVIKGALL